MGSHLTIQEARGGGIFRFGYVRGEVVTVIRMPRTERYFGLVVWARGRRGGFLLVIQVR